MGLSYYVIDTETTGIKAGWHEITEISIIRCSDRNQLTRLVRSDYPERANPEALRITGRSYESLSEGESKRDIVNLCNAFFEQDGLTPEHRCIIGHNVNFDKRFCHALWGEVGEVFPAVCWLDSLKVSKEWAKKIGKKPENYKLSTLLKFADINIKNVHTAEGDTRSLYILWEKYLRRVNTVSMIKRDVHKI